MGFLKIRSNNKKAMSQIFKVNVPKQNRLK